MGVFGNLDVDEIPDDPFYVEPNTYWATITDAKFQEKDGDQKLIISWQIDEPDSEYNGNRVSEWLTMPDLEGRSWDDLGADERRSLKYLMRRLRRGLDLTTEEINDLQPSMLLGLGAFITTKVNKGYINIKDVVCKRIMEEERAGDITSSTLGL